MERIKVGMVEDQYLFRKGLKSILESWPDIDVMFEAERAECVIESLQNGSDIPDIMLVDLNLGTERRQRNIGYELLLELQRYFPTIRTIVLSVYDDEYHMIQAIENGASAYLVKDSEPQEVYDAIVKVHKTGSYINSYTLGALQGKLQGKVKKPTNHDEGISQRELEVLELVCKQYTAEEIGEKLFISPRTVNGHKNHLLQKTGSRNTAGLVLYAVRHDLVDLR